VAGRSSVTTALVAQGPPAALAEPVDRPQPLGRRRRRILSAAALGLAVAARVQGWQ